MAGKMIGTWLAMMIAVVAISSTAIDAATHVVGGSAGWTIPSNATLYSEWSSSQTFAIGDTLVFNFTTGIHNVIEVPKSGYDACSPKNQVGATLATGPATVTVKSSGNHYYICGVTGHCSIGQKVAISVGPAASGSAPVAAPTPAPTPTAPVSAPTPAPTPMAGAPVGTLAPRSSSGESMAPVAPVAPVAPSSGSGGSSTTPSTGPSSSTTGSTALGPSGGSGTSAAPPSSLSSGYLRCFAVAAILVATSVFLL